MSLKVLQKFLILLCVILINFGGILAQNTGRIKGNIRDKGSNESVVGATIYIKKLNIGTSADAEGNYTLVNIPEGTHVISCSFVGYGSQDVTTKVIAGQTITLNFLLKSAGELDAIQIEATKIVNDEESLLEERRKSGLIQDGISLENMEKSASLNAAQALQKVTGVSLREGKYVAVRGMTDRNLVVQMNGTILPGANPERSSVPLDLIPSQMLDNITVEKSVTPDKAGNATGATIEIKTRSIPEETFISIIGQLGFNSNIGFMGKMLSFKNGEIGFWGTNVKRFNISQDFLDLRVRYTEPGNEFSSDQTLLTSQNTQQAIINAIRSGKNTTEQFSEAQRINRIMESFDPVLSTQSRTGISPNQIYSVTFGNRFTGNQKILGIPFNLGDRKVGLIVGLNYYRRSEATAGSNNRYSALEPGFFVPNIINPNDFRLIRRFNYQEHVAKEEVSYGALATLAFEINQNNQLSLTYNRNQGYESFAFRLVGTTNDNIRPADQARVEFPSSNITHAIRLTERPLQTWQLRGEHSPFKVNKEKVRISWSASRAFTNQNDPDFRLTNVRVDCVSQDPLKVNIRYNPFVQRYWRFLNEQNTNLRFDATIPFKLNDNTSFSFKTGGWYLKRERDYTETVTERKESPTLVSYGLDLTTLGGDLNKWAGPNSVGIIEPASTTIGGNFVEGYIFNPSSSGNSYNAFQTVQALYVMTDAVFNKNIRVVGGIRVENTETRGVVDTAGVPINPIIDRKIEYDSVYITNQLEHQWLPSVNVIYSFTRNMQFRLAYSKTLARPELNEIINSSQFDPIQQADIRGNNRIRNANYENFDIRWDWFMRPKEVISASLFYKKIYRQLERVFLPLPGEANINEFGLLPATISFRNNPNDGFLYGAEFEFRKKLDIIAPPLKNFLIGLNTFIAYSETPFPDDELYVRRLFQRDAKAVRPLFEQPNYIINANIGFDKQEWGASYNVFFNWTGDRLTEINIDGTPNIYERTAPDLDFIFSQELLKRGSARFSTKSHTLILSGFVKNILQRPTEFLYKNSNRLGDNTVGVNNERYVRRSFTRGTEVALGLKYIF